jgi:hypothetical protein
MHMDQLCCSSKVVPIVQHSGQSTADLLRREHVRHDGAAAAAAHEEMSCGLLSVRLPRL